METFGTGVAFVPTFGSLLAAADFKKCVICRHTARNSFVFLTAVARHENWLIVTVPHLPSTSLAPVEFQLLKGGARDEKMPTTILTI